MFKTLWDVFNYLDKHAGSFATLQGHPDHLGECNTRALFDNFTINELRTAFQRSTIKVFEGSRNVDGYLLVSKANPRLLHSSVVYASREIAEGQLSNIEKALFVAAEICYNMPPKEII